MTLRSNLHSAVVGLIKSRSKRWRKRSKTESRSGFFERLEDRLMLNGTPVAKDDLAFSTPLNTALTVTSQNNLLLNDWDPEGSALTASVVANPANGSLSNFSGSAGTFTYTPSTNFTGIDSFTYKVSDGVSDSNTVTVAIAVGGHFGPRANLEEQPRFTNEAQVSALAADCSANSAPVRLTASCLTGDLYLTQTLMPGLGLVYNSGTLPKPIIVLETFLQLSSNVPDEIKAKLTFNGTAGTNYGYSTTGLQAGDSLRFALQADATSLATGRYPYTVTLTARFNTTEITRDYTGYALVVNRGSSTYEFGRGWQLAGLDKLVSATGGMMLVRSTGEALWFADSGSGGYLRADGDSTFSSLVRNADSTYTLTTKHGDKTNFSSAGLLTSLVDRNNNTTSFTYASGLLSQITDPFNRNTTLSYTNGRLTSVTDFASRTATLAFDGTGRLASITQSDPDGSGPLTSPVWSFAYDATIHQLTQITSPLGQVTQFAYGSHNRLTTITHPDTRTWQIGRLQTIGMPTGPSGNTLVAANPVGTTTNELSAQSTFRTDHFGRITQWTDPNSNQTLIVRNADAVPAKVTPPDPDAGGPLISPVTILGYDLLGNLKYQKNPDNSTKTWTYTSNFNFVASATDELNRIRSFAYDTSGNMTSSTDAAGYVTSATYTTRGLVASITSPDPDGVGPLTAAVTSFAYDSIGRLTTLTNPDASTRVYTYDSADNRLTDRDELLHTTSFTYDQLGRQTSTTDRVGATTSFAYSALGLLTKVTDALGNATDYEYNNRNWQTKIIRPDPDGAGALARPESTRAYDDAGNLTQQGEPFYNQEGGNITYGYDSAGQHISTSGPLAGVLTTYTRDNLGRVTKITDPLFNETAYEYNARGWTTKVILPDPDGPNGPSTSAFVLYAYDAAGQRTQVTDPRGSITDSTYNSRGLLSSVIYADPDGSGPMFRYTVSSYYDNTGRLTSTDDSLCRVTSYAYNNRDFLTSVTEPDPDFGGPLLAPVTSYSYDVAGRRTAVTDPLSRVTSYSFDDEGRVTGITRPDPDAGGPLSAPVTAFGYNLLGSVTSMTDPRGGVTATQYDTLQRRTQVTSPDPDGAGPLASPVTTYVYNAQGLVDRITDPIGRNTTYSYDSIGRRSGVTDHLGNQTTLAYNALDILTSVTHPDPDGAGPLARPITSYAYDPLKRLSGITDPDNGTTGFTYDEAGNLLTLKDPVNNTTSYAYDGVGRMTIETNQLGYSRSYTYDASGVLTRRADRNGRAIQYERDNLDRITAEKWYQNGTPVPTISISTTTQGGPNNEVQRVGFTAGLIIDGTFSLTFNGSTTSALAYNATPAQVQSALEALSSVGAGDVSVTKLQDTSTAQEWRLTFQGTKAATDVVQTTVNSTNIQVLEGVPTNIQATDTQGGTFSEVQTVTLSNANGGTFRLAFNGQTTAPINQNASAATVDSGLEELNSVDLVNVTGNAGGPWTVTFVGTHSNMNVAQMNGDASSLTGGTLTRTISYSYDVANQLTSSSDTDSSYAYTYDNLGRVLAIDNNGTSGVPRVILTSAFDAGSNRTSLTATVSGTNDFQNAYTYDNLNRLTRLDQQSQSGGNSVAEKRVNFSYNAIGQFTQIGRYKALAGDSANEIATSAYTYDTLGRLTGLAYKKGGTNLFTPYSWTFDSLSQVGNAHQLPGVGVDPRLGGPMVGRGVPTIDVASTARFATLGRVTQFTSQDGTTAYTYDATSELTGADHSYQIDETYTYDANGNRTMTGYETGSNNRLLNDGIYSYQYDNEGNRTRRTKTSDNSYTEFEWDFRNRFTKVTDRNSSAQVTKVVEYKYDVFDRRISRAVDTTSPFDLQVTVHAPA